MKTRTSIVASALGLAALAASFPGCSPADGGGTGGAATGGVASGGSATGGAKTGGTSGTGGSSTGGSSTGGSSTGGSKTGGVSGTGGATGGATGTGGDMVPATWATVAEVVRQQCSGSGCHGGETPPHFVYMDDKQIYQALTTLKSTMCGNRLLVKAGAPNDSAFYLAQFGKMCGSLVQMPKGCVDLCTPMNYLDAVKAWIVAGAPGPK